MLQVKYHKSISNNNILVIQIIVLIIYLSIVLCPFIYQKSSLLLLHKHVTCVMWYLLYIGNGKILDNVVRHGPHDLYWCYRFERSVSSYKSIKTNQKLSKVTYCKYEARVAYRIGWESIAKENDNLYPP